MADAAAGAGCVLSLLECEGGSTYAGITNDLKKRWDAHCTGRGARYTRMCPPLKVLAVEAHPDRSAASRAEWQLKRLSPDDKRRWAGEHALDRARQAAFTR